MSATTFSDLYKWTMLPVVRKLESLKPDGQITVTFGIDLRDEKMRKAMKADPELITQIHSALIDLQYRKFDREIFTSILAKPRDTILSEGDINAVCGPVANERTLVDEVKPYNTRYDQTQYDIDNKRVTISFYENPEAFYKSDEKGV